jgi:site-specific DNA-methyltransferase (adenine-specific)
MQYYADKMRYEGYNESYPVTLDKDNVLIDGGHRIEAAKIAGIEEVPYVVTDAPRIAHSLRCNRDGADTLRDDVFDLAELCWKLAQNGQTLEQINEQIGLGWSPDLVSKHKLIKERLCGAAWGLARSTNNDEVVDIEEQALVESNSTNVEWKESHFRALLAHLPYTDGISAHNQIALIRDCFVRYKEKDKITAQWIKQEAVRYGWYAELHRYVREHIADEVPLADKVGLVRGIYNNAFGKKPPEGNGGNNPLARIEQAVSILNEHALGIKLYHDDTLQRVPLLDDNSIALVINDPPYNVTNEEWDKIGTPEEYLKWTHDWLVALRPKLADNYHLFLFCAPEYQARIETLLIEDGWPLKSRIIWEYRNLPKGRDVADKFITNWQMVFHCGTHTLNWPPEWNAERFEVQCHATPQSNFDEGKNHPMAKPLSLIEHLVRVGSAPGDKILDMFAGGGTTGKACQNVGQRRCILIESEEKFIKIMEHEFGIKRIEGAIEWQESSA